MFDRVANTPIEIMRVDVPDGSVQRPRALKAQALPMGPALEWLKAAEALDKRLTKQEPGVLLDVLDFVCAYSSDWPSDAIRTNAAPAQIVNAFYLLKELNDPFAVAKQRKTEETERGLRMLEVLGKGGGGEMLTGLIEKHLKEASADSEKSSASTHGES